MTTALQGTSDPYWLYNSAVPPPTPLPPPPLLPPGALLLTWHPQAGTLTPHPAGFSAAPLVSPSRTPEHIPVPCPPVSASSSIQTVLWCDMSLPPPRTINIKPMGGLYSIMSVVLPPSGCLFSGYVFFHRSFCVSVSFLVFFMP